jgi:ribonuclease P protein component
LNRLSGPADYQPVFRSAKKIADSNFLFLYKDNNINSARLGMAISKKRIHSAVQRNKIKRMIRESFRHNIDSLGGLDIVILAQKSIKTKENEVLKRSLAAQWNRLIT